MQSIYLRRYNASERVSETSSLACFTLAAIPIHARRAFVRIPVEELGGYCSFASFTVPYVANLACSGAERVRAAKQRQSNASQPCATNASFLLIPPQSIRTYRPACCVCVCVCVCRTFCLYPGAWPERCMRCELLIPLFLCAMKDRALAHYLARFWSMSRRRARHPSSSIAFAATMTK